MLSRWLTNKCEPIPYGPGALDPEVLKTAPRKTLLDRFEQHTQRCPSCKRVGTLPDCMSKGILTPFPSGTSHRECRTCSFVELSRNLQGAFCGKIFSLQSMI